MTDEMKAKRDALKALSNNAKMLVNMGQADTINNGLALIYSQDGHTVLKSFKQWKAEGYSVRKGSKALLMWGEPLKKQKQEDKPPATEAETEKEADFFPLAYVFSNLQVEPLQLAK